MKIINKLIQNIFSNNSNTDNSNDCILVQNYQILDNNTPDALKNLSYGIYPENPNYNNFRLNYNRIQNYNPCAIFYPSCSKQLGFLISNMVKYNLNFSLRCGSRAYEPASLSSGFVIDVSKFDKIKIDKKNMCVKVGSGVKLGNLINELASKKLIMTTGDSSCVGVSGLALAGGKGYLSRLYGMACDNIIGCKLIDAKGKQIICNEKNNSDLLWALKGSGHGSYGAITEFKFKIYNDIFCQIATLKWEWNSSNIFELINFYQQWIITKPNNITTNLNMTYSTSSSTFYIKFFKFSNHKKSKKYLENFNEIDWFKNYSSPSITYSQGFYTELLDELVNTNTGNSYPFSKIKSTMVFDIIEETGIELLINSIDSLILSNLPFQYQINFSELSGAVENNYSSCYFPKSARFVITILNLWENQELEEIGKSIPNELYNQLKNYTSPYCLPNMIDYDLEDYLTSYYGTNQTKLIEIKNKYDPDNIFKWKQSIPIEKTY